MPDRISMVMEIIGAVAFAVSGALTAVERKMDILGVIILGVMTAVGGGVLRDVIIGSTFIGSSMAVPFIKSLPSLTCTLSPGRP